MFHLSRAIGALTDPAMIFVLLFLLAVALVLGPYSCAHKAGKRLLVLLALLSLFVAIFPIGKWALVPLENRFAQEELPLKVDGIVMVTGDESPSISKARHLPTSRYATQRYVHVARLAQKYPSAVIVISGNMDPFGKKEQGEAYALSQQILEDIGVPLSRVRFENESRTTHENAVFAYAKVQPKPQETWLLVTSGFHMPRAVLCFEHEGWYVVPSISDYFTNGKIEWDTSSRLSDNLRYLSLAAHEYIGLLFYRFLGWVDRSWP